MTYEDNVTALSERTASAIEGLWVKHQDGGLSFDEFRTAASGLLAGARAKGVSISELTLAGYLQQSLGMVPAFAGLQLVDAAPRLEAAVLTIAGSNLDTVMQLKRLATSEVLTAAAEGFSEAIRRSPHVDRYTRGLDSGACELCRWLYKDGFEYPASKPMHTHTGCKCHPVPVT